jgi:pimeloyl-ACP methyl ester carboxylesterase
MVPAAAGLEGRYHGLRLPVSILAGGGDRIVDPEHQSIRLHAMIEQSELLVLPGLGHMIHYFATDQVVRAIDSVSARAESRSRVVGLKRFCVQNEASCGGS